MCFAGICAHTEPNTAACTNEFKHRQTPNHTLSTLSHTVAHVHITNITWPNPRLPSHTHKHTLIYIFSVKKKTLPCWHFVVLCVLISERREVVMNCERAASFHLETISSFLRSPRLTPYYYSVHTPLPINSGVSLFPLLLIFNVKMTICSIFSAHRWWWYAWLWMSCDIMMAAAVIPKVADFVVVDVCQ